jgi:hypothetical protein
MLRLLIVALPLVVALPAALDKHEANAIQFVVQSTLQFEVRSPPESRRLLPAATRDQHRTAPPHTHLHTHNTQAHTSPCTRRGTRARARRSTPRSTSSPTSSSPGTPTHHPQVCPRPCRQPRMQRAQLSVGPAAARAHARDRCTCCKCTRTCRSRACPNYVPAERRSSLCARRNLRSPSARASAPPAKKEARASCFADGLRVAPPVQAAAAASARARRLPLRAAPVGEPLDLPLSRRAARGRANATDQRR